MINVGQIVKLDDNKEYIILNKMNLHNINYIYLITLIQPTEMLVVTETNKNGEIILEEIKDNDELDYVLSQFVLNPDDGELEDDLSEFGINIDND